MGNAKTFYKVSNKEVFMSLQSLHQKIDAQNTKYAVQQQEINNVKESITGLSKVVYGAIGTAVTICLTFVGYLVKTS